MHRTLHSITLAALLACTLLGAACSTMSDVMKSKDEGTSAVYPVTTEQAFDIARTVFRWEGCDAIEEHESEGYMLTSSGANWVSYGAVMGAWVDADGPDRTKVTVVTKRRLSTDIATTLTESTFQKRFQQAVEIVKSGKPLPIEPPPLQ